MSFWTGSISKSVKTCDERSTLAIPIIHFHDFSLKNYLNRYAKQNKSGSAYERGGDARRKFWIKPLKETDLGVAQPPKIFLTPKRDHAEIYTPKRDDEHPDPFPMRSPPRFEGHGGTALPRLPLSAPLPPPPPPISAKFWRATITFFSRKEKKGIYLVRSYRLHDVDRKLLTWDHALSQVRNPPGHR